MNEKTPPELDRLFEDGTSKQIGVEPSPSLERSIIDRLTPSLAPVKRLPSQSVLTVQFLTVFVACTLVIVATAGWKGIHFMTGIQTTGMAVSLTLGAILFSIGLASQMVPGARQFPLAALLAFSGLTLFGAMELLFPSSHSAAFVSEGLLCATTEFATALPAAGLFWLLTRRGARFDAAPMGAIVSGLAAFLGLAVTQTRCMFPTAQHLLVWHAGVAALIISAGAIIVSVPQAYSKAK